MTANEQRRVERYLDICATIDERKEKYVEGIVYDMDLQSEHDKRKLELILRELPMDCLKAMHFEAVAN